MDVCVVCSTKVYDGSRGDDVRDMDGLETRGVKDVDVKTGSR